MTTWPWRAIAETLLQREGYVIESACDGIDAMEKLREKHDHYDLVLLDLAMPRLSGDGVLKAMKAEGIELPVIVCSGYLLDLDQIREYQEYLEPVALVQKPYDLQYMLDRVREVLCNVAAG